VDFYYYVVWAAIFSQLVFDFQMIRNYVFAVKKAHRIRTYYRPRTALIVPCKGLDAAFEANITSLYQQNYDNYILRFVVSDTDDPAYDRLCRLKEKLSNATKAHDVQVLVAGHAQSCGQKNHNLLYCFRNLPGDVEVMAFADSDACVCSDWLASIVHPLRKDKVGVSTGYRWFIPQKNNPATVALAVINAKIAQLLGSWRFNQAWGGSMAVRSELFRQWGVEHLWANSITDDLTLSRAARKTGKKITFVPACLVASYEQTNWPDFFRFARRQFLITRVAAPVTWLSGLLSSCYSTLGLYGGAAMAVYAYCTQNAHWKFFAAVPAVFFAGHLCRSTLRQRLIAKLLPDDVLAMRVARFTDIAAGWLLSPVLLAIIVSSAFGRRIRWRGITYKLVSFNQTLVES
jgi:ceramide glucosyltransferase